tara:strand:- start:1190 stop:1411 length:222 start_codon:yes stop_codon:yes gene_type:complete
MTDQDKYVTVEVRYLSMSHTSLQVEYTDTFGAQEEAWIAFEHIKDRNEIDIFADVFELEINHTIALREGFIDD